MMVQKNEYDLPYFCVFDISKLIGVQKNHGMTCIFCIYKKI